MEPTKKDWKLYRERIGDWQEAYMEKLVQKYVEYLQENLPASDKFWELENRIKNDKKKPGVLIEVRKSSMIWDIVRLIHDEVVTVKDLEGFSNELVEAVRLEIFCCYSMLFQCRIIQIQILVFRLTHIRSKNGI